MSSARASSVTTFVEPELLDEPELLEHPELLDDELPVEELLERRCWTTSCSRRSKTTSRQQLEQQATSSLIEITGLDLPERSVSVP